MAHSQVSSKVNASALLLGFDQTFEHVIFLSSWFATAEHYLAESRRSLAQALALATD
jgi:hypothetical protein